MSTDKKKFIKLFILANVTDFVLIRLWNYLLFDSQIYNLNFKLNYLWWMD